MPSPPSGGNERSYPRSKRAIFEAKGLKRITNYELRIKAFFRGLKSHSGAGWLTPDSKNQKGTSATKTVK